MSKGRLCALIFGGLAIPAFLLTMLAFADEPTEGLRHELGGTGDHWRLDDQDSLVLSLFQGQTEISYARYELTGCRFCTGEDDNCEKDGIAEVNFISYPNEPILAVTCHVGAHSQRLQILRPWQNKTKAVYSVTGEYYITFEQASEYLTIAYDVRKDDGTYAETIESWP